jgi:hypothetical protein
MSDNDIVTRLLAIHGFGWQCGKPLKDKGSYFRCPCGCSAPGPDWDGHLTICRPEILKEAADEVLRIRAERDEARRELCVRSIEAQIGNRAPVLVLAKKLAEDIRGWDCFKEGT